LVYLKYERNEKSVTSRCHIISMFSNNSQIYENNFSEGCSKCDAELDIDIKGMWEQKQLLSVNY